MAYCRFSDGDVYLFYTGKNFECCGCRLAPLVRTTATSGYIGFFEECPDCNGEGCKTCWCSKCKGEGCEGCMVHGSTMLETAAEALEHLEKHREAGHYIPEYTFKRLKDHLPTTNKS